MKSKTCLEIAQAYARTMEITEASLDPATEDYGIHWEDAVDQVEGLDPELKPVILTLLKSQKPEIHRWVERQIGAELRF